MFELLLVEDNPGDVHLTKIALQEWGRPHQLLVSVDGMDALNLLETRRQNLSAKFPDLILLDLNLPRKDGREVLATLKGHELLKSIPVIVLSTSDAEMDIIKSYSLGANSYIVKPMGIDNFIASLKSALEFWIDTAKLLPQDYLKQLRSTSLPKEGLKIWDDVARSELSLRLLIVDDNPADCEFVKQLLSSQRRPQFDITSVDRLDEAINLLGKSGFDIVLLDLGLPDSQGIDTYSTLAHCFPHLPVVINTILDNDVLALHSVRSGAQEYIVKDNVNATLLIRVIQHAIERKQLEQEKNSLILTERDARKVAEEALLARDDFLSVASHELKTPITTLLLQIDVFKRTSAQYNLEKPEVAAKLLREIMDISERQIHKLSELTDNLLDMTRISAGRLELVFLPINLTELVSGVIEKLKMQIEKAKCQVSLNLQSDVWGEWDAFRIEQVLVNLMTNAFKYGGGQPIDVSLKCVNDRVVLSVSDSGVGIGKEDQDRIFFRFERLPKTKSYGGLGLGLYIVRQIIDAHCGSIRVESSIGNGSRFTVELPLQPQHSLEHA